MNDTEITFYHIPCYLNEIRKALKHGPLGISEIEYYELPIVAQFPQFPQLSDDYLDYVFLFGLFTSFAVLSLYSSRKYTNKNVDEIKYKPIHKDCNKTKVTEKEKEAETFGTGPNIV